MNLHLRIKAFIVALVCCCAGAWGQLYTSIVDIDFSNGIVNNSVVGKKGTMSIANNSTYPTEINADGHLVVGKGTNTVSFTASSENSIDKVSFDIAFGKLSNRNIEFYCKDASGNNVVSFSFCPYSGVLTNNMGVETGALYYANSTVIWERKVSFTITLDYANDKMTTTTECYLSGAAKPMTTSVHEVDLNSANHISSFVLTSNYDNNDRRCQFDNLKIESAEVGVPMVDFVDPIYSANEIIWTTPNAANTKVTWEKYNEGTETINSHDQAYGGGFRFGSYYPGITTDGYSKVVISFNLALANPREQNVCNLYLMGNANSYKNEEKPSADIILNFEWVNGTYKVNGISFANYIEKFTTTPSALVSGRSDGGMKLTPVTVTLDFATHKAKVEFAKKGGGVATIDDIDFVSSNVSQFVGFCDNIGRYDSAVGLSNLNVQGIKSVPESAVTSYSLYYQLADGTTKKSEVNVRGYVSQIVKAENVITGTDGEQYQLADDSPTSFEVTSKNASDNVFYATVTPYVYSYTINYTYNGAVVFTENGGAIKGSQIALREKVMDGSQNYYKNSQNSVAMPGTDNYVFSIPVTKIPRANYTLNKFLVENGGETLLRTETGQGFVGEDVVLDYNGKTYFDGVAANKYRYVSDNTKGNPVTQDGSLVVSVYFKKIVPGMTSQPKVKRNVVAVPCADGGEMISWRSLDVDKDNPTTVFDVYRDGSLIAKAKNLRTTTFVDEAGTSSSSYVVKTKVNGEVTEESDAVTPWANVYKTLTLNRPAGVTTPDGVTCSYSPNDCSVADVDGDGDYEIVVKWDPSNSGDNMPDGYRGNVYLDCYEFDGTQKWRIDLGVNIRAGAHYTQFLVYDFDGDGCAELVCKTAPGTKDGQGNYVSLMGNSQEFWNVNNYEDYRSSGGTILAGPEYLTVFDANTGSALNTVWYNPNRAGEVGGVGANPTNNSVWGDNFGNRSERYLAAVAYLDGMSNNPSAVMCRGYYARANVWAVDFDGSALTTKWFHSSTSKTEYILNNVTYNVSTRTGNKSDGSNTLYENGNHNLSVGDVDGDGKDEIIWGAGALDDDGKLMYATGFGHGDAIHLTDIDPDRPGLEVFDVHEEAPYGWDLHDARTGEVILSNTASNDNGRGMAADLYIDNRGLEFWSARDPNPQNAKGEKLSDVKPAVNFRTYWDGDLTEEFFDAKNAQDPATPAILKNTSVLVDFHSIVPSYTNNSTKSNPCLQADILGDWREEIILRGESTATTYNLNIFSTTVTTPYLVTTPMQDHIYRMGVAWQNVAYNQPPHLGYYLPDVAAVKVTIGKNGYTTFCSTKNFTTKGIADVTAHTASLSEGSKTVVDLVPVVEVPAGEGVIIKGVANATYYLPVIYDANEVEGNILTGTTEATTIPANSVFVLNNVNGVEGFYNYGGTSMPANKAYISKSVLNDNGIKAFTVRWVDNETTAVHGVAGTAIGNGKNAIYNLQGIRVAKPGKGIYIVNGRKVVYN